MSVIRAALHLAADTSFIFGFAAIIVLCYGLIS